eukprot:4995603-Prymnesium_polylepis.1
MRLDVERHEAQGGLAILGSVVGGAERRSRTDDAGGHGHELDASRDDPLPQERPQLAERFHPSHQRGGRPAAEEHSVRVLDQSPIACRVGICGLFELLDFVARNADVGHLKAYFHRFDAKASRRAVWASLRGEGDVENVLPLRHIADEFFDRP